MDGRFPMCRCAAMIVRAVVTFLDTVLIGWFLSCFHPHLDHSAHNPWEPLVSKDWLEDDRNKKSGFEGSRGSHEDLTDSDGIDRELRHEVCIPDQSMVK